MRDLADDVQELPALIHYAWTGFIKRFTCSNPTLNFAVSQGLQFDVSGGLDHGPDLGTRQSGFPSLAADGACQGLFYERLLVHFEPLLGADWSRCFYTAQIRKMLRSDSS